jgi:L-ribulose-5-phosphate 4-epimerase
MEAYELNTGKMIAQLVSPGHANDCPAAIIRGHGAFALGKNTTDAVYHATVLEEVAKMLISRKRYQVKTSHYHLISDRPIISVNMVQKRVTARRNS